MGKPKIFIDIDGTVADSIPWWLVLYNAEHHTTHSVYDMTTYDPKESLGISLEKYYEDYRGVTFMSGFWSAYVRLNCYYDLRFVTVGYGEEWLRMNGISGEVIRIKDRSVLNGYALIDDCEKNLFGFQGHKYLMKQPWNNNSALTTVTWAQIEEDLLKDAYNLFTPRVFVYPI
jgi:5'(3')-deoxyribonucleotidase